MRSRVSVVITSSAQFQGSLLSALIIKSTAEGKGYDGENKIVDSWGVDREEGG
jgi:hypothetical protein